MSLATLNKILSCQTRIDLLNNFLPY